MQSFINNIVKMTMTDKQRKIFEYYKSLDRLDKRPTYSQASKDLGIVPSVLFHYITKLEEKGYIKRDSQGGVHIIEGGLDQKIVTIAKDMRPGIKLPKFGNAKNERIDLLRCAVLKKDEENSKMEQFINDKF